MEALHVCFSFVAEAVVAAVDGCRVGLLGFCQYDLKLEVAPENQIEVSDGVVVTAVADFFDVLQIGAPAAGSHSEFVIAFPVDYFEVLLLLKPFSWSLYWTVRNQNSPQLCCTACSSHKVLVERIM